jgi:hypothetical protein
VRQHWIGIDDDARLLEALLRASPSRVEVETRRLDLATDIATLDEIDFDALCASALLDLTSSRFLDAAISAAARRRAAVLFTLSYDGRMALTPSQGDDERVREAFNAHQRRDKGFGPALGPVAAAATADALDAAGFIVRRAASDWTLSSDVPDDAALMRPLVDGIARAAAEQAPESRAAIDAWRAARTGQIGRSELRLVVGHEDTLGLPQ